MANGSRSRKNSRRSGGSGSGKVKSFAFVLVLLGALFAFFQIPSDPSITGIWNVAVAKSKTVEAWAKETANELLNINIEAPQPGTGGGNGNNGGAGSEGSTGGGSEQPPANVDAVTAQLNALPVQENTKVKYNRKEWKHWNSITGCWDVREQVLANQAVAGSLVLLDGKGKTVTDVNAACSIQSGKWIDPYTNAEFTDPGELDIDHLIPLSRAAQSGGQAWDSARKQAYANDLTYSSHLLAVDAGENRTKGDKGPAAWKPKNEGYWCSYATAWVQVSTNYGLSISPADKNAVIEMLRKC